jgi:hypothetical protein
MLKDMFDYNKYTGDLIWKWHPTPTLRGKVQGRVVGNLHRSGYVRLDCLKQKIYAHRIVWALFNDEWPSGHIVHINGDKTDNRIENLKLYEGEM